MSFRELVPCWHHIRLLFGWILIPVKLNFTLVSLITVTPASPFLSFFPFPPPPFFSLFPVRSVSENARRPVRGGPLRSPFSPPRNWGLLGKIDTQP